MAFVYPPKRKNPATRREVSRGFPEGMNTLAHPSALKNTELSSLLNGQYSQYGTISKRLGTKIIGEAEEEALMIQTLTPVYDINGNTYFIKISDTGIPKYYNFTTKTFQNITGTAPDGYVGSNPLFTAGTPTFDTSVRTWIVQAGGKVYFANAVNDLIWWDGTQWYIYDALTDPVTKTTVAKTGAGTGTRTYYYRYVDYNSVGGTLASPVFAPGDPNGTGHYTAMPEQLDSTTYLTVTLPTAAAGAVRRGIFRGNLVGEERYLDTIPASETSYIDQGAKVPSNFFGIPTANTTKGFHFKLLAVFGDTLVGTTTEMGDDYLVYSGYADKIGQFALADGGGYYGWRVGDGEGISALKAFAASNEEGLYVFKNSKSGRFNYNDEGGSVQDINISIGTISPLSPHAAGNNLRLWTREGPGSLGNEAQFGTIIRYSLLGIKADAYAKQVTPANLEKVAGEYFNHLSLFSISTDVDDGGNDGVLVYDERYNAWSFWRGIYAAVFARCINPLTKEEKLYFGSSKDGNVLEMFSGKTDESTATGAGNTITFSMTTKAYDMGVPEKFKKMRRLFLIFSTLIGSRTTVQGIQDGYKNLDRYIIPQTVTTIGFGTDVWGEFEVGYSGELSDTEAQSDNIRFVNLKNKDMLSLRVNIMNDGVDDEMEVMGLVIYYSESNRSLPYRNRLRQLADY